MRSFRLWAAGVFWLLPIAHADVRNCACDATQPATLEPRECSLCKEAEKQEAGVSFFLVHDANPNKPNRWLALPRSHVGHPEQVEAMTAEQRTAYWKFAIAKARELWGEDWGIALNSLERRTQCHTHLHIGKLLPGSEDDQFVLVDGPDGIPLPKDGNGVWIHPVGNRYHVHLDVPAGELKLQR